MYQVVDGLGIHCAGWQTELSQEKVLGYPEQMVEELSSREITDVTAERTQRIDQAVPQVFRVRDKLCRCRSAGANAPAGEAADSSEIGARTCRLTAGDWTAGTRDLVVAAARAFVTMEAGTRTYWVATAPAPAGEFTVDMIRAG